MKRQVPGSIAVTGAKVGDTVQKILKADVWHGKHELSPMKGTITKIAPASKKRMLGGVKAYIYVKWENGHEGRNEDRGLVKVSF